MAGISRRSRISLGALVADLVERGHCRSENESIMGRNILETAGCSMTCGWDMPWQGGSVCPPSALISGGE